MAPFHKLRFGDFDGDGTTDVFASWGGNWYVSYGSTSKWNHINQSGDPTHDLLLEDLDGDGETDIIVRPETTYGQIC